MDNVLIKRLSRSLKYEAICLSAPPTIARPTLASPSGLRFTTPRSYQAVADRTAMVVWREGATAVDMTLRLDNALALPTCDSRSKASRQCDAQCDNRKSERPRVQLTPGPRGPHTWVNFTSRPLSIWSRILPSEAQ